MSKALSLFEQIILEAPGDDPPPDVPADTGGDTPPDLPPEDTSSGESQSDAPPDIDDEPPDLEGGDDNQFGMEDFEGEGSGEEENLDLDEKISAVMNMNLYQRYLALLNNIGNQLSMIKNNSDMLYTLSNKSLSIIGSLKKLDENIRLYIKNYFLEKSYSENLLFFNKCINLLKLLNDIFEKEIRKGIRGIE